MSAHPSFSGVSIVFYAICVTIRAYFQEILKEIHLDPRSQGAAILLVSRDTNFRWPYDTAEANPS